MIDNPKQVVEIQNNFFPGHKVSDFIFRDEFSDKIVSDGRIGICRFD